MPFRTILCPVDFSTPSRAALRYAAEIASASGGEIVALFVNDPLLAAATEIAYDGPASTKRTEEELRRFARRAVSGFRLSPKSLRTSVAVGRPAEGIVKAAGRVGADLIVMGTQGLTGPRRLVLGSTTEAVLRKSQVPVLAVPPGVARSPVRLRKRR